MTNDRFHDPFNPKTGKFAGNIRARSADDLSDLLESMKSFGWLKHFPAIQDENGVTLVGHRRLRAAEKLGIDPVIEKFNFGQGDEADAERLKLALASNIGFKQMTRDDRKRIAEYLYGQREWTMEKIADALDVSAMTVSRDLGNFNTPLKSKPAKTIANPKGAGRPKGSGKKRETPVLDRARAIVRPLVAAGEQTHSRKLQAEHGISHVHFETAIAVEKAQRDAPPVDATTLAMTAQQKLALAIRQHKHKLDAEFDQRVRDEVRRRIDEMYLPAHHKLIAESEEVLKTYRQKGIFTSAQFKKIVACLHPDRVRDSELKEKYTEAFNIMNAKRLSLVSEAEEPTQKPPGFPKTYQELMELRAKTTAARKTKRADAVVRRV